MFSRYLLLPYIPGAGELAVFLGAMAGAGLGFLWFNAYPAEVFMGDVGALALGAALGTVAVIVRQEIVLAIMGGVFVAETLSVAAQVLYFRHTGGKRIFRMAPLHQPLRTWRLEGNTGRRPLLDHHQHVGAGRPFNPEDSLSATMELKGKRALVVGLGESGLAMAKWLARQGAIVRVADSRPAPPNVDALRAAVPGAELVAGDFTEATFADVDLIAISPGVPVQTRQVAGCAGARRCRSSPRSSCCLGASANSRHGPK